MTEDERRSFSNLLLLCYRHHVETNDVVAYPVTVLREMKAVHEDRMTARPFSVSDEVVAAVMEDAAAYWAKVDIANTREHIVPHLRVQIDVKASPAQLFDRIRHALDQLAELHAALTASADALPDEVAGTLRQYGYDLEPWLAIPYWQNPTINRDWEIRVLGLNNFLTDVSVLLDQLEVRHLEAEMARGQVEESLRVRLDALRSQLLEAARSVGYVD